MQNIYIAGHKWGSFALKNELPVPICFKENLQKHRHIGIVEIANVGPEELGIFPRFTSSIKVIFWSSNLDGEEKCGIGIIKLLSKTLAHKDAVRSERSHDT